MYVLLNPYFSSYSGMGYTIYSSYRDPDAAAVDIVDVYIRTMRTNLYESYPIVIYNTDTNTYHSYTYHTSRVPGYIYELDPIYKPSTSLYSWYNTMRLHYIKYNILSDDYDLYFKQNQDQQVLLKNNISSNKIPSKLLKYITSAKHNIPKNPKDLVMTFMLNKDEDVDYSVHCNDVVTAVKFKHV